MIKTITKRNGKAEPFDPDKVNGWGIWASKTLGASVNWQEIVLGALSGVGDEVSSKELQERLITQCLSKGTWEYNRMAGRLYASQLTREVYGTKRPPTVKQVHERMREAGLLIDLGFSQDEYAQVEQLIDHTLDLKCTQFELKQLRKKYAIRNLSTGQEYETPQFIYMRMAMALAAGLFAQLKERGLEPKQSKIEYVKAWYGHFANKRINVPTPYFTNLGTKLNGFASCCLYTTKDTWPSLAAGDHIAYAMTCMSAGIGSNIVTRSLGEPIRGGRILHQGKRPYYKAMVGAIGANLQNGRGGAATTHYSAFDSEASELAVLRNPMTPISKRISGTDYSFGANKVFARKVARNEKIAPFSIATNPELWKAMYGKDEAEFERLYNEWAAKVGETEDARKLLTVVLTEGLETGRHFLHFPDAMNKHTPFKDPIYSSNLCQEIAIPTNGYKNVEELYSDYEEGDGEIGLCSLAGIIPMNVASDEQYADACYYSLLMIDVAIHLSTYIFKNLEHTAKARMSAGVGLMGVAHWMAKHGKKYSTQEGRNALHELFETHSWHLINASLRLGQELGNAPWMHKTLWPEGWLPIDTYERRVDELVTVENKRDWESLRQAIIANGGIRNSVVAAHMPGESSSISAGTTNGIYPIRGFELNKTNDTLMVEWVAPDSTRLKDKYEIAWDIEPIRLIEVYAIAQKWTDQGISADQYRKVQGAARIGSGELIEEYLAMVRLGLKTRYYHNSLISQGLSTQQPEEVEEPDAEDDSYCESCAL